MFRKRFEYVSPPLSPSVRSTLCHCEAPLCGAVAISRKGHRIKPPRDTFVPVGKIGVPKRYFVLLGKRNKQAKDKQLTFTAIDWSKVKFMTRTALCSLPCEALYVIAKHRFAVLWQSPGRDTA